MKKIFTPMVAPEAITSQTPLDQRVAVVLAAGYRLANSIRVDMWDEGKAEFGEEVQQALNEFYVAFCQMFPAGAKQARDDIRAFAKKAGVEMPEEEGGWIQ